MRGISTEIINSAKSVQQGHFNYFFVCGHPAPVLPTTSHVNDLTPSCVPYLLNERRKHYKGSTNRWDRPSLMASFLRGM